MRKEEFWKGHMTYVVFRDGKRMNDNETIEVFYNLNYTKHLILLLFNFFFVK